MRILGRNSKDNCAPKACLAQPHLIPNPASETPVTQRFKTLCVDPGSIDRLFLPSFTVSAPCPGNANPTNPESAVTKSKPQNPQTFEQALAEIEGIVAAMEAGQLPLEQSLAAYKRGAELLQFCHARLQDAQQQVKVLEAGSLQNFTGGDSAE
jgi:exodeoxyribonuclease VII small subunit